MTFRCVGSPLDEMKRLETLRERDPESAINLVANGKLLVDFVRDGNLRALQCAAEHLEEGQMLIFYAVRMFREACASRRLDILRFVLLNGFDLQQNYMRDVLHGVIESIDSPQSADAVQPLVRFLLDAGVDVNWQRKSDLYTALHVACCKNLYPIVYLLVLFGADVNAIAADDSMPLSCANDVGQKWVDPKQQRAEELLQDTWHEIGAATNWSRALDSPTREVLRSKLLDERLPYERLECHLISSNIEEQAQFEDNQAYEDPDPSGTAVHDAMPPPKRPLTSASLQPKKSKAHLSVRCRSASFNNSDYQSKNWFVRSALELNEHSQRAPKPRRKAPRQHSVITSRNHLNRQARKNKPSPPARVKEQPKAKPHEVEIAGESITKRQARAPKLEEPVSECPLPVPKVNDLSFYMLELRLVHPEPLAEWRFQASFSDMSVVPSKTVILDDLTVDDDNFLLFDSSQATDVPVSSRYFNPFLYFPGLRRPSDLYGHVLRIIVTSISPVTRIVINTSVQFTRSPDEAVVEPSAESIRRHSEAVARQEASLLRVLARRNSSTTSIQIARRKKKTHTARLQEVPWRKPSGTDLEADNVASTASLAIDQCSPWSAGDQDDPTSNDIPTSMLEKMFALQLEEPRYPSPVASPRKGPTAEHLGKSPRPPMTTIDKKKMQLQHLRANMRRGMREENCNMEDPV
ncbi:Ankyrin repeat-containing domain [Phytophthora cinnamomi]|uniref:Ankyrin repeat-containing domain n=1 Tax=Phytophthora cinnamomi TaxID=4785 RepID=UPI0035599CE2|nr:Ankyrin repeat-containing domain [Phytophthora cinnamomi]